MLTTRYDPAAAHGVAGVRAGARPVSQLVCAVLGLPERKARGTTSGMPSLLMAVELQGQRTVPSTD